MSFLVALIVCFCSLFVLFCFSLFVFIFLLLLFLFGWLVEGGGVLLLLLLLCLFIPFRTGVKRQVTPSSGEFIIVSK